jgi:hypothetical protein
MLKGTAAAGDVSGLRCADQGSSAWRCTHLATSLIDSGRHSGLGSPRGPAQGRSGPVGSSSC